MPLTESLTDVPVTEPYRASTSQGASNRSQFLLLQTIVVIVLSYELLFSFNTLLSSMVQALVVVALLLSVPSLMLVPAHLWEASWFIGALIVGDTAITSSIIYLSGDVGSDLYLTYFLIIFLAGSTHTLNQHIAFSAILCAVYGLILYWGSSETDLGLEGHGDVLRGRRRGGPKRTEAEGRTYRQHHRVEAGGRRAGETDSSASRCAGQY